MYSSGGLSSTTGIFTITLIILIKVLVVVFVISLLIGLYLWAKNYLFNAQDIATFKSTFIPATKPKKICSTCGKTLENDWKVCPYCSAEETFN